MKIKYYLFVVIIFIYRIICTIGDIIVGEKKYSFFIKSFSNQISKVTTDYKIFWDYKNNKMLRDVMKQLLRIISIQRF